MHYAELEVRQAAGEGWGSVVALHPEHRVKMKRGYLLNNIVTVVL